MWGVGVGGLLPPWEGRPNLGNAPHFGPPISPFAQITCGPAALFPCFNLLFRSGGLFFENLSWSHADLWPVHWFFVPFQSTFLFWAKKIPIQKNDSSGHTYSQISHVQCGRMSGPMNDQLMLLCLFKKQFQKEQSSNWFGNWLGLSPFHSLLPNQVWLVTDHYSSHFHLIPSVGLRQKSQLGFWDFWGFWHRESAYLIFVTSTTSTACGEKICHVEKFFHMTDCHVEKFLHMRNMKKIYHREKALHMINLEQNVLCGEMWRNLSCGEMFPHDILLHMNKLTCFVAKSVLSQFTLLCRKICFVAIYALLCGEKLNQKFCLWRKKDKY